MKTFTAGTALSLLLWSSATFAQMPGANDPDMKELVAYQLTIPTLNKVLQVTKNVYEAAKTDPRFIKQAALKAEIKKLQEKEERTEAEDARLEKLQAEVEQIEDSLFPDSDNKTLSQLAADIQKEPLYAKALANAGLNAREYVKFLFASLTAGMVAEMLKQGVIKEVPKDIAATVNMDNVKFMQQHAAEFEAFRKAMETMKAP